MPSGEFVKMYRRNYEKIVPFNSISTMLAFKVMRYAYSNDELKKSKCLICKFQYQGVHNKIND